jgi:O-antigen ligase
MRFFVPAIVCLFYALTLVVDRSAGVLFGCLLLVSVMQIIASGSASIKEFGQFAIRYWQINLAMAAPLLAALINLAAVGHFDGKSIDYPLRLAMFPLIFWALQNTQYRWIKHMQWFCVIGAIAAAIKMYVLTDAGQVRYLTDFIPIGIFTEMLLLIGFFSAFSLAWENRGGRVGVFLKGLALSASLYAAYISGCRGPWLTIPVFIAIGYAAFFAKGFRLKHVAVGAAIAIACTAVAWHAGGIIKERIAEAQSDLQQYSQRSNVDTSLGLRLQIWRGSWTIFEEHPIFGVGSRGYGPAMQDMADRKIISPMAATFVHSHNDILFMMTKYGVFGLVAILALYLVPASMMIRCIFNPDKEIRSYACMGVALSIGFMILGFTDVAFMWWEIPPFYTIGLASFLTLIDKRSALLSAQA